LDRKERPSFYTKEAGKELSKELGPYAVWTVEGKPVTVDSDIDVADVLQAMESRQIRRVPVIQSHQLVGMIREADLARHLPEQKVGEFVGAVCPPG
jgi:CBS domain-containing protein